MNAMVLQQIAPIDTSPLALTKLPLPAPAAGELRLKVACCAICRTDLHVIEGDLPQRKLPIPEMDYERHVFYERDICSVTCNTRADGRNLLAEAAEIPIRPHVTTYPLADANRALQDLKHDRINGTGVLVTGVLATGTDQP